MCQTIDEKCLQLSNILVNILSKILYPIKYLCGYLTKKFQRPYSLCFLLNFFILITPAILLVILLIQNAEYINSIDIFNFSFYFTLFNLVINYIIVFHIYYLYGRHRLTGRHLPYSTKHYTKYICNYLFTENRIGLIGIYLILQCFISFVIYSNIKNNKDYNSDKFDRPILIIFTEFGIICNIIFTLGHIIIYSILFLLLLCRINNSCICRVCYSMNSDRILNPDEVSNHRYTYFNLILSCYKYFGIYDEEKDLFFNRNNIINI